MWLDENGGSVNREKWLQDVAAARSKGLLYASPTFGFKHLNILLYMLICKHYYVTHKQRFKGWVHIAAIIYLFKL